MGTRWSAVLHAAAGFDPAPARAALQAAVDEVDTQMSTWKPASDLMRLNAAPPDIWVAVPDRLWEVLACGLEIGRASNGAFDIGLGDAVAAWGFGPAAASAHRIRAALAVRRRPAHEVLELDHQGRRARKHGPLTLDLSGIAKGYGVDRLAQVAGQLGMAGALMGIDGELRALGLQPDGRPWSVAIERPDPSARAPLSILALQDAAVATSGDYRHRAKVGKRMLSHTMDPRLGGPLATSPASVTIVAATCMVADAWATALMVLGSREGAAMAAGIGLDALFVDRAQGGLCPKGVGRLFEPGAEPAPSSDARSAFAIPAP